jgi:hypothetical protein
MREPQAVGVSIYHLPSLQALGGFAVKDDKGKAKVAQEVSFISSQA